MSASSLAEPIVVPVSKAEVVRWSFATRFVFRFFFAFFPLFLPPPLPFTIPGFSKAMSAFWNAIVPPVALTVFGVRTKWEPNGSGDTTWDWSKLIAIAAISLVIALVWSVLDRRSAGYPRLHVWLRVYLRYALAIAMFMYGVAKVIPMQFQPPPLDRLMQPFGDASPMGLLWTFMGASMAYTIFAGASELLGGLLLTTRRTALLGALVSAAVLTNIVMLNFSYDVPVKIYSSILLLSALFIIAPDAKRLLNLFVLNRPVEPTTLRPSVRPAWAEHALRAARTAIVILFVVQGFQRTLFTRRTYARPDSNAALHGIWNVDELTVDGVSHPPLVSDATRWRRIIFTGTRGASIQLMSDQRDRYSTMHDPTGFILKKRADPLWQASFFSKQPDPNTLLIEGVMDGRKIAATLRRSPEPSFLLTSRGFHWINETPFNR
jgi:hypothetical protein